MLLKFGLPIAHDVLVSEGVTTQTTQGLLLPVLATQVGHFTCRQALLGFSQVNSISYSLCTQSSSHAHFSSSSERNFLYIYPTYLNMLDFGYFMVVTVSLNEKNIAKTLKSWMTCYIVKPIKAGKLHVLWFPALDRIIFKLMCSQCRLAHYQQSSGR